MEKTALNLIRILFVVAITCSFAVSLNAAQTAPVAFDLFSVDSNLGHTDLTQNETASARPVIRKQGRRIYQVLLDKRTGRELFRVQVGTAEAAWWVYGLVREADFNADGIPDFTWHGGDDTSDLNLVVLSSPSGYRKIDVGATLRPRMAPPLPF